MKNAFHIVLMLLTLAVNVTRVDARQPAAKYRLSSFSADVTIPLDHRCMGVLPTKSKKIVDRLFAHGFVLLGADEPLVLVAVDWCEIRNGAYDQWREALAKAAGTTRERVLVSSLHQHDAPVTDAGAARLLKEVGLANELYDEAFHARTLASVADALKESLADAAPVTHIGLGQARVKQIASNRRVVSAEGRVSFSRGSASGSNAVLSKAPDGLIDPFLKTISFWNSETPLVALHAYATHPMSYYGRGGVTSDFVGLARDRRQRDLLKVKQIYVSGCSGDVTAGKYNDGSHDSRLLLTQRLYEGMVAAWENTKRHPLETVDFRNTQFDLPYHPIARLTEETLTAELNNEKLKVESRILAAMGLSSRQRQSAGQKIDMPCIDLGRAQIVLFPGESFVGYQLMAQKMRPDSFVLSIGYGECWPGYVPTKDAFDDNFSNKWLWVGPGSEARMLGALRRVLPTPKGAEQ
ncbi:MAG: hypothetical protein CMJ48_10080 [Planctomycetaceae bacterium]|nr:hypothetical protein [Planctomycetaceae bacterium]